MSNIIRVLTQTGGRLEHPRLPAARHFQKIEKIRKG